MGSDRSFLLIFVLRISSYKCAVRKKYADMKNPFYPCEINSRVVRVANYCWTPSMNTRVISTFIKIDAVVSLLLKYLIRRN